MTPFQTSLLSKSWICNCFWSKTFQIFVKIKVSSFKKSSFTIYLPIHKRNQTKIFKLSSGSIFWKVSKSSSISKVSPLVCFNSLKSWLALFFNSVMLGSFDSSWAFKTPITTCSSLGLESIMLTTRKRSPKKPKSSLWAFSR